MFIHQFNKSVLIKGLMTFKCYDARVKSLNYVSSGFVGCVKAQKLAKVLICCGKSFGAPSLYTALRSIFIEGYCFG